MNNLLELIEQGGLLPDLAIELEDVAREARSTNKPGRVTLILTITPKGLDQVEFTAKVDAKAPRHDRSTTTLYVDGEGHLTTRNPRQLELSQLRDL